MYEREKKLFRHSRSIFVYNPITFSSFCHTTCESSGAAETEEKKYKPNEMERNATYKKKKVTKKKSSQKKIPFPRATKYIINSKREGKLRTKKSQKKAKKKFTKVESKNPCWRIHHRRAGCVEAKTDDWDKHDVDDDEILARKKRQKNTEPNPLPPKKVEKRIRSGISHTNIYI